MNSIYEIVKSEDKLFIFCLFICSMFVQTMTTFSGGRGVGGGGAGADGGCRGCGGASGGRKIQTIVACFGKFIKTFIPCNSIKTKWFFTVLFYILRKYMIINTFAKLL